jgi:hypothetical protein
VIRSELTTDFINSFEKIACELSRFLLSMVEKIIAWIHNRLWHLPEIRREMIGEDENTQNKIMQKSFFVLIQRIGRPAANAILRFPRQQNVERIKFMNDNRLELIELCKFMEGGRFTDRDVYQSFANGKHKQFVRKAKSKNVVIEDQNQANPKTLIESEGSLDHVEKDNLFKKEKPTSTKLSSTCTVKTPILESSINDEQLAKLNLSEDTNNLIKIQHEIELDVSEFVMCMKYSVYHCSGIHRFYIQELDNLRSKFIEIEENNRIWSLYVFDHFRSNDGIVGIPLPNMTDEITTRNRIAKALEKVQERITGFDL